MKRFSSAVNLLFLILLLLSCSSIPDKDKEELLPIRPEIKLCTSSLEWNFLGDGIQYCKQECPKIPLVFHLVKINLATPNLELVCYPLSADLSAEGSFPSKSPLEFARQNNAIVAINASPFDIPGFIFAQKRRLVGIYIANGIELSSAVAKYGAIAFVPTESSILKAKILKTQENIPQHSVYAFGGFFQILLDGQVLSFNNTIIDSRMAVGVSEDDETLLVLFAEGEKQLKSEGLTFQESAYILKEVGAWNALLLDGGASAAMVVDGINVAPYQSRKAANILGFKFH
ncbi:MAG: phosphodiester glycosidase family protein [Spirochaetaceae bacterium]|nr:phosphodiester glycosidase family protein [Spirochaetaceae bacterium]